MRANTRASILLLVLLGGILAVPAAVAQPGATPADPGSPEVPAPPEAPAPEAPAPEDPDSEESAPDDDAAPADPATPPLPPASRPAQATGGVRFLVFVGSQPTAGVLVEIDGVSGRTGADGTVVLDAPAGPRTFRISVPRHLLPAARPGNQPIVVNTDAIEVVEGEQVEAILSLDARGGVDDFHVESAADRAEERRKAAEFEERLKNAPKGKVSGKVFTGDDRTPVEGARIFVRGLPVEARSDTDGAFELELPEGNYELTIIHTQYSTAKLEDVDVDANRPKELRVRLEKATARLDEFVVTAPHIEGGVASLVAERRESSSVDDVIGAEEMSRSGDSDAAGALKRVTGITVVGGQYVYVRGMGERYSVTLLNQQAIPSPEPERRVIPLDLFSTDVLESVVIQKTPSPDTPAEFGGGVVLLRTKSFPDEFVASAEISTGLVTTATFQERPGHDGGDLDFLGFDDGTRTLPQEIRDQSPLREGNRFQEGFTAEELAEFGRMLPGTYNVHEETVPLDTGLGFSIGDKLSIAGMPAGFLVSGSYGSDYGYSEEEYKRFVFSDAGLQLNNDFVIQELGHTISSSNIITAGIEPAEGHSIKATTLLLRISDSETGVVTGKSDDLGAQIRQARLLWVERQLISQQLSGAHEIAPLARGDKKALLDWRYAFSQATRAEPDRREYFYSDESSQFDDSPPDFQLSARPSGNQRIWSDLTDHVHDVGLDYTQPFPLWNQLVATAKAGATTVFRNREYDTLRLTFKAPRSLADEVRRQSPEEIWSQENINGTDGWILEDTTQPTDAYAAEQQIQAGYAMATVPVHARVEVTAGARVERSRQRVETFSPFTQDQVEPKVTELDNTDILPSITGKWQISDELVLRGGYGRTVSRPDFRELSESSYRDVLTARRFVGNPLLERATIDNVDARLEYYFSTDELASISAFYKAFNNPIEQVDLGGVDRSISWDNADSASNLGVEIEARRRFGFLAESLDEVFAALNVALIRSEVNLGDGAGVSTSQNRPLQGQSPYVINAQLGYDDASDSGITAVLLYNVFGRRIRDVGRLGTPDIYESPFHQLDFVYGHELGGGWKIKFKAKNLLDQEVEFIQGEEVARRYRGGRELGISLAWSHD